MASQNLHFGRTLKFNSLLRMYLCANYSVLDLPRTQDVLLILKLSFCIQFAYLFCNDFDLILVLSLQPLFICHFSFEFLFIQYWFSLCSTECSIYKLFSIPLAHIFIQVRLYLLHAMHGFHAVLQYFSITAMSFYDMFMFHLAHSLLSLLRFYYIFYTKTLCFSLLACSWGGGWYTIQ